VNFQQPFWDAAFFVASFALAGLWPLAAGLMIKPRTWFRRATGVALIVWLASLALVSLGLEEFAALSRSWIFCLVVLALGLAMSARAVFVLRLRSAAVAAIAFSLFVGAMGFGDFYPNKPFMRFYDAVQPGMNRADVLALLHREFPDGGGHHVPTLEIDDGERLHFILDLTDGRWNAEWVTVHLRNGVVAWKHYDPD